MAMARFYFFFLSRVGRFSHHWKAIAGVEIQKIFWRGAGSIPRNPQCEFWLLPGQKGQGQASRRRRRKTKELTKVTREREKKKDALFVSSVIQPDGNLTGKDGPAGC